MEDVLKIIKDPLLTYEQKVINLARLSENSIEPIEMSDKMSYYFEKGIVCGLNEGNAPYRPRYILPDYEKFMEEGSEFLNLKKPENIWEAANNLLILYKHVPSVTTFPVYIGNIDKLLDPFIDNEEEAYIAIKNFLLHIDRTVTDSFCHGNLGPEDSTAARLILRAERELENSTPNLTLKLSDNTSEDFLRDSIETALKVAKPSFANDKIFREDFGGDYGIASCYNGLRIGGGSYTLVRLNLYGLAKEAKDPEDFLERLLPEAVEEISNYMDQRVRFIVDEADFFKLNFLAKEGLIDRDKFSAMFGMFGLAEGVNHLLNLEKAEERFGHGKEANDYGLKIIDKLYKLVSDHKAPYCDSLGNKYLLHAQVGIESDNGTSPGCRIPINEEPDLFNHIIQSAKFHKYFPSGIGDIFPFDEMAEKNPSAIRDVILASFKEGMRYFSIYGSDADVIRITGYLVKKSDMDRLYNQEQVLHDTVVLGLGARENSRILERKVRSDESLS